ncbi:hypothetical protein SK803_14895 [Lentzea sp. BCCO 10_0856]|uniref:Tryptophan-associated transmembrane protein (Trp_oprn_chp) n=1 Tax=Lentzea miocenica TaxID=3095431 RepID=A0ABU4T031_9PSEU|nr:hypothetical protein [Lentzea sp. BCCO 10_0856]MDX8031511.1 hypothetical protein [Lentzea sp. BCCO 10_0856]
MRSAVGAAIAAVGLVTSIAGTFLPWLKSGSTTRDSYEVLSLRDLAGLDGVAGSVVTSIWVGLTPLAMIAVALFVVRFRRFAACVGLLFGTISGTVALLAAVQGDSKGALVGISIAGPVTTLAGAVLTIVGAITVLTAKRRSAVILPGGNP